jgi:hypothetical protein
MRAALYCKVTTRKQQESARRDLVVRRDSSGARRPAARQPAGQRHAAFASRATERVPHRPFPAKTSRAFCPDAALPRRCRASLAIALQGVPSFFAGMVFLDGG